MHIVPYLTPYEQDQFKLFSTEYIIKNNIGHAI